jgi:hypothetical protein
MHGSADGPLIARVAAELRRTVPLRPDFDARVMAAVRHASPSLPVRAWTWLREPRVVAVSPIGALAMAAGLAGIVVVGALSRQPSAVSRQPSAVSRQPSAVSRQPSAVSRQPSAGGPPLVTFVLLAPQARSVALAGDFNDWDASRVLMRREASGLWTVDVPLTPGRYRYVFVVDGRRFVADPAAPRAAGDDFGTPTSVVTVGGGALRAAGGSL